MRAFFLLPLFALGGQTKLQFGPKAVANHEAGPRAGCDPDYGWLPGAAGTDKCYMLIKSDSSTCYSDTGYYGMDWFDAMQCCYYQHGYVAEPMSQEEHDQIAQYLTISIGGDKQNAWWIGGTDLHHEGTWLWMSGAPWSFENWGEGEPNQNGNEDCAAMDPQNEGFGWMDLDCSQENHGVPHYTVCEKIVQA